ncbi:MAG: hypothetical protein ACYDBQ_06615 [Thermoplasmatota archaeon]
MRSRSVRLALKGAVLLNLVLLGTVILDFVTNHAALMLPLLVLYGAFLLCVLLLYLTEGRAKPASPVDPHPIDEHPVRLAIVQRP